jgi:hypothetical protein
MRVRIIDVPPGEAPEDVRRAWVGLSLPLADGYAYPMMLPYYGVLTGPRSWVGHAWRTIIGRVPQKQACFLVSVDGALRELSAVAPDAARWWRENVPAAINAGRTFGFPVEVCQREA